MTIEMDIKEVEGGMHYLDDSRVQAWKRIKAEVNRLMKDCPRIHAMDKEETSRLNGELFIQKQFVETRDGVINGLKAEVDRLQKQWQGLTSDYTSRLKDISNCILSGRPVGISYEQYNRVLPVAQKEKQCIEDVLKTIEELQRGSNQLSKTITIEKGILVIMRDGRIINFPNGNDETYKAWCNTPDSETFLTMLGAREEFLEHELERAEADQIVRGINENGGSVEDSDDFEDRIEEFCKHHDPRKYTKKMQEEMANTQDQVKP